MGARQGQAAGVTQCRGQWPWQGDVEMRRRRVHTSLLTAGLACLLLAGTSTARPPDGGGYLTAADMADHVSPELDRRLVDEVNQNLDTLQRSGKAVAPRMAAHDWLGSYAQRGNVDHAVRGIATRLSRNGERLVACRNPDLAERRARKRREDADREHAGRPRGGHHHRRQPASLGPVAPAARVAPGWPGIGRGRLWRASADCVR